MDSRNRLDIQLERQEGILNRACKIPYLHDKAMSSNSMQLFRHISDFISHDLHHLYVEDPVPSLPFGGAMHQVGATAQAL